MGTKTKVKTDRELIVGYLAKKAVDIIETRWGKLKELDLEATLTRDEFHSAVMSFYNEEGWSGKGFPNFHSFFKIIKKKVRKINEKQITATMENSFRQKRDHGSALSREAFEMRTVKLTGNYDGYK